MALPNKAKIPVGTVLAGKYRITREIGRGGMAAVYEAANVDIGKRVAIKVLAQELTTSAVVVERFLREARAAAAIRSPYICDIYDSGKLEDGRPFLVLELLEGESLYERMTKIRWLDAEATMSIVTQTCRGLTKAHAAEIVHRDLKPENIFLTRDEEGAMLAKILDFGLAKFYAPMDNAGPQARLTREGAVFGTPAYMSPEQVRGQGAVDHRADLWALGCIVYECFTGRTVWSTEQGVAMTFAQIANAPLPRPALYRPDLPEGFTTWFDRALSRDITRRFQTAKEFADEFVRVFRPDEPVESSSTSRSRSQLLSGASVPSVKVYPPLSGATPHVATDALTEPPPPKPSAPLGSMPQPAPNPLPSGLGPSTPSFGEGQAASPDAAPVPPSATASGSPSTLGFVAPESRDATKTTVPPRKRMKAARRLVVAAFGVAIVGAAGLTVWQFLDPAPPVRMGTSPPASDSAAASSGATATSASSNSSARSAPTAGPDGAAPPWMAPVRDGQQALAAGDLRLAGKLFKEAFDKGAGHGVPRTLLEHLAVATASGDHGSCRLNGLARPRTYDLAVPTQKPTPAGRPSIVVGVHGAVVTWTDAHEGPEHAYSVALDEALRDTGAPVDVTPEGIAVGHPELRRSGDKLVLSYGDAKGPEAGVHARFLDPGGHIAGPAIAVAPVKAGVFAPAITGASDGTFFVAWSDDGDADSEDLFLRRLGATLEPVGDVVRVTDLVPTGPTRPRARAPSIAIGSDALLLGYRLERDPLRAIHYLRLPITDAGKGLDPIKKGERRADRTLGESVLVNNDKSKADAPSIACGAGTCFLAWHGEGPGGGASAAFVDPTKPKPIWWRKFSRAGGHPAVGVSPAGQAQMVWYESGKLMTASVSRDGVGTPTRIARVSGDQPTPSIAAGNKPGEWYVAWLDYETGHLEAYAARVQCK